MSRSRRFQFGSRGANDPLVGAAVAAGGTLLVALGLFFTRPAQPAPRAASIDYAAVTSTTVSSITIRSVPGTTTTSASLPLGSQLPLTGPPPPTPPTTARPSSSRGTGTPADPCAAGTGADRAPVDRGPADDGHHRGAGDHIDDETASTTDPEHAVAVRHDPHVARVPGLVPRSLTGRVVGVPAPRA